jgi:hypothetical protein
MAAGGSMTDPIPDDERPVELDDDDRPEPEDREPWGYWPDEAA